MGKEGNGRDDVFGFEKCRPLRWSMTDEFMVENPEQLKVRTFSGLFFLLRHADCEHYKQMLKN